MKKREFMKLCGGSCAFAPFRLPSKVTTKNEDAESLKRFLEDCGQVLTSDGIDFIDENIIRIASAEQYDCPSDYFILWRAVIKKVECQRFVMLNKQITDVIDCFGKYKHASDYFFALVVQKNEAILSFYKNESPLGKIRFIFI